MSLTMSLWFWGPMVALQLFVKVPTLDRNLGRLYLPMVPTLRWGLLRWYLANPADGAIPRRADCEVQDRAPGIMNREARVVLPRRFPCLRAEENM